MLTQWRFTFEMYVLRGSPRHCVLEAEDKNEIPISRWKMRTETVPKCQQGAGICVPWPHLSVALPAQVALSLWETTAVPLHHISLGA